MTQPRLVMIPGMGADERLFTPQRERGFAFDVPTMPMPDPDEDLRTFAVRVRDEAGLDETCVVVGVSFGGMVLCELAAMGACRAAIVVSSCRSGRALPPLAGVLEWGSRLMPDSRFHLRAGTVAWVLAKLESLDEQQYQIIRAMALDASVTYLRRVWRMIVDWPGAPPPACPLHHIHGARDRLLPVHRVRPDVVVPDGGHLINMTHPEIVNAFIEKHLNHA